MSTKPLNQNREPEVEPEGQESYIVAEGKKRRRGTPEPRPEDCCALFVDSHPSDLR